MLINMGNMVGTKEGVFSLDLEAAVVPKGIPKRVSRTPLLGRGFPNLVFIGRL
jgi:hypothetical protein